MIFPYKFQTQPYISWKGHSTNSVVPGNSRGGVNGYSDKPHDFIGPSFKARPIKHYRKKLIPNPNSGKSKASIKNMIDTPGNMIYLGINSCVDPNTCQNPCCVPPNKQNAWRGITTTNMEPRECTEYNREFFIGDKFFDSKCANISEWESCNAQNRPVCVSCNPENNIIKSGVSLLNKNYYTGTKAYLQSRCKLYEQNASIQKKSNIKYIGENGQMLWPTDNPSGPQNFNTKNCPKGCSVPPAKTKKSDCDCSPGKTTTIYKPSNRKFAVQGSVSSSNRLLRLKVDTITKNGNSFRSAIGNEAANAGRYRADQNAPYFLKSKYVKCISNKRRHSTYQKGSNQLFSRVTGNKKIWWGCDNT